MKEVSAQTETQEKTYVEDLFLSVEEQASIETDAGEFALIASSLVHTDCQLCRMRWKLVCMMVAPTNDDETALRRIYLLPARPRSDSSSSPVTGHSSAKRLSALKTDLGDVLVMPVAGDAVPLDPGDPKVPGSGYRQRFSHAREHGSPGHYAVDLLDSGISAELTAGTRVGVFPAGTNAVNGLVLPDSKAGRVYFITGLATSAEHALWVFDQHTLTEIGHLRLPGPRDIAF